MERNAPSIHKAGRQAISRRVWLLTGEGYGQPKYEKMRAQIVLLIERGEMTLADVVDWPAAKLRRACDKVDLNLT